MSAADIKEAVAGAVGLVVGTFCIQNAAGATSIFHAQLAGDWNVVKLPDTAAASGNSLGEQLNAGIDRMGARMGEQLNAGFARMEGGFARVEAALLARPSAADAAARSAPRLGGHTSPPSVSASSQQSRASGKAAAKELLVQAARASLVAAFDNAVGTGENLSLSDGAGALLLPLDVASAPLQARSQLCLHRLSAKFRLEDFLVETVAAAPGAGAALPAALAAATADAVPASQVAALPPAPAAPAVAGAPAAAPAATHLASLAASPAAEPAAASRASAPLVAAATPALAASANASEVIVRPHVGAEAPCGASFFAVLSTSAPVIAAAHAFMHLMAKDATCTVRKLDALPGELRAFVDKVLVCGSDGAPALVHVSLEPARPMRLFDAAAAVFQWPQTLCILRAGGASDGDSDDSDGDSCCVDDDCAAGGEFGQPSGGGALRHQQRRWR